MGGWGEGTAPLPMSTQAFVNEMITTVTIAQASPNYQYSSLFGLGFETLVSYYTLEVRTHTHARTHAHARMHPPALTLHPHHIAQVRKPEQKEKMRVALAGALLADPAQV